MPSTSHAWRLAAVIALAAPTAAVAQSDNEAAATTLFERGKQLVTEDRVAEACHAFEASMALVPRLGVQLNLADCYERAGRTASAWVAYGKAAALARQLYDDRGPFARERLADLARRLSRLTITVPAARAGLEVRLDGAPISPSVYGVAVPVDPGEHVVEARAPGAEPWSSHVTVDAGHATGTVDVPALSSHLVIPRVAKLELEPRPTPFTRRTAFWFTAGLGVAGVAAGTYFGVTAWTSWRRARAGCDQDGLCVPASFEDAARGHRAGNLATVAFAIGGGALATALVLHLTRPHGAERALQISAAPGHAGVTFTGGF